MACSKNRISILKELELTNFKSYGSRKFEFDSPTVIIHGDNGVGKTNLLDGIYYLAMTRSYFQANDTYNIKWGKDFYRLQGLFRSDSDSYDVVVKKQINTQKVIELNGKKYQRFSDHLGKIPVVFLAPKDQELITGSSAARRKLMDHTLCQSDKVYLKALTSYKKLLKQRNKLLKTIEQPTSSYKNLLLTYSHQMLEPCLIIHSKRKSFLEAILPLFQQNLDKISMNKQQASLNYTTHVGKGNLEQQFEQSIGTDMSYKRTTIGVHKDDIVISSNDKLFRKHGSQGQLKSALLSIVFAQALYLRTASGKNPMVLIDDIFDKLDSKRVEDVMDLLRSYQFSQLFISDTSATRSQQLANHTPKDHQQIHIQSQNVLTDHAQ